jgi:hypothetical protein
MTPRLSGLAIFFSVAAPAVGLGAGVVPVVGRPAGRDLGEAVALEEEADDGERGQVRLAVVGQEVRQPETVY